MSLVHRMFYAGALLLVFFGLLAGSGCRATRGGDPEDGSEYSDIPWNRPQPWEGTVPMPIPGGGNGGD
jgi:hypothetical protein